MVTPFICILLTLTCSLPALLPIVEFRIPSYPEQRAKNVAQKRGLCRVKSFAAKYKCTCSCILFATTIFKTISVKELEPNFVIMKVPELKKYCTSARK